jgi:glutamate N-acetyltransferase/amino-acid N-acetyltransferase
MNTVIETIAGGGVTSPPGFGAGVTSAGIKEKIGSRFDLGIMYSDAPCVAAGVFTSNRIKAAPVVISQLRLESGNISAVVVNSGCANACTAEQGMADAREMTRLAAEHLGVAPEAVLVASTGVIGVPLPMDRIRAGMGNIVLSAEGGHDLARAIMTTDTVPKEVAVAVKHGNGSFTIGGIAKGSGMIHPDMATLLCFLTTDASVEKGFLQTALKEAIDASLNMVSVDGDTSTNDTVLLLANGRAGNERVTPNSGLARTFRQALNQVCIHLAKCIARDGEGAGKLIEVTVNGAGDIKEARRVARTVVSSNLLKAAVYGSDPNWGRVLAAAGRSGVAIEESKIDLYFGGVCLVKSGRPVSFDVSRVVAIMKEKEVPISLNLNTGAAQATAWGCDLTEEYVRINSEYTT